MSACIHIYTSIHVCIHAYVYTQRDVYMHTHMYTHTQGGLNENLWHTQGGLNENLCQWGGGYMHVIWGGGYTHTGRSKRKPVPSLPPATTAREVHPTRDLCAVSAAGGKKGGKEGKMSLRVNELTCVVKSMCWHVIWGGGYMYVWAYVGSQEHVLKQFKINLSGWGFRF